ncbi:MAG TPA: hypothetical protein VE326_11375 [Candidatus Binatia bacterium]|nr:hypothetical protein [Candidatus Binatia bacterium]
MIRDDLINALRSVELPAEVRARVPYGELADAVEPVLLGAAERMAAKCYLDAEMRAARKRGQELGSVAAEQPSITCPKCGGTSYNANDIRKGYCVKCHERTGTPTRL